MTLILIRNHHPFAHDFLPVGALSDENAGDDETSAGLRIVRQLGRAICAESRGGALADKGGGATDSGPVGASVGGGGETVEADPNIMVPRLASGTIELGPWRVAGEADRARLLDFEPAIPDSRLDRLFEGFDTRVQASHRLDAGQTEAMTRSPALPTSAPLLRRAP